MCETLNSKTCNTAHQNDACQHSVYHSLNENAHAQKSGLCWWGQNVSDI